MYKSKKCNKCNREFLDENYLIYYHVCYIIKQSGNKVIDDFIRYTQTNFYFGKMEFVPYDQFVNVEFIAEGGFSKIYKAIYWNSGNYLRQPNSTVVLKKLNNSKNVTSKELNELKVAYQIKSKGFGIYVNECFGITQDPITQDVMIIMPYYELGDLLHYITNDFYNISWSTKLLKLNFISLGLIEIHRLDIVHRDLHSGNIFIDIFYTKIGDLGISKSATESSDDNNENYGIIPYMAPEIFQGQKYTTASDVYSLGMIMWELMTGRRPFWDRDHDTALIIKICDGLRPPIVTNAPEGYIELIKECWHSDPSKRPTANDIEQKTFTMYFNEYRNSTKITKSSNIGPVTINNPDAIFKSRPLSGMIKSAISLRTSRNRSINNLETDPFYYYHASASSGKRKSNDDEDDYGQGIKKRKLFENENDDYFTKEIELDINTNNRSHNNKYITKEIDLDINAL